jgi:hypothetical protein
VVVMQRQGWLVAINDNTQEGLLLCGLNLVDRIAEATALRKR